MFTVNGAEAVPTGTVLAVPTAGPVQAGAGVGPTRGEGNVPVGAGPPGGGGGGGRAGPLGPGRAGGGVGGAPGAGVRTAVSVTVAPGSTLVALVEAVVARFTGCRAMAKISFGSPQPTGVVMAA